jgi:hypothetical protein
VRLRPFVAGAIAATALTGCGGGGGAAHQPLAWTQAPQVFRPRDLPRDRVALGHVRNASNHAITVDTRRVVVRDARGHALEATVRFIAAYAHGLFGAFQQPGYLPQGELRRLGIVVELPPGQEEPLSVAFRLRPDSRLPARIDYGRGTLAIPVRARVAGAT